MNCSLGDRGRMKLFPNMMVTFSQRRRAEGRSWFPDLEFHLIRFLAISFLPQIFLDCQEQSTARDTPTLSTGMKGQDSERSIQGLKEESLVIHGSAGGMEYYSRNGSEARNQKQIIEHQSQDGHQEAKPTKVCQKPELESVGQLEACGPGAELWTGLLFRWLWCGLSGQRVGRRE